MDWMVGYAITAVSYDDQSRQWFLAIGANIRVFLECPWQIIANGGVSLASGDHGQQYGLPAPIDACARAMELLGRRKIERVTIDPASADLRIEFAGGVEMRTFNDSSGYEAWNITGPDGKRYIAQGGGSVVML
jgi:hypothetical protein